MADINEFTITGRVTFKNYRPDDKILNFGLAVYLPRVNRNHQEGEDFYRDFPSFSISGEAAANWKDKFDKGSMLTTRGHFENPRVQQWVGRNYFKMVRVVSPIVEELNVVQGGIMKNSIRLKGEIARIRRGNADSHYYLITIRTVLGGNIVTVPCIYFDGRMNLDAGIGDKVDADCILSTRRVPLEFDKDRTSTRSSVVIQTLSVEKISVPSGDAQEKLDMTANSEAASVRATDTPIEDLPDNTLEEKADDRLNTEGKEEAPAIKTAANAGADSLDKHSENSAENTEEDSDRSLNAPMDEPAKEADEEESGMYLNSDEEEEDDDAGSYASLMAGIDDDEGEDAEDTN